MEPEEFISLAQDLLDRMHEHDAQQPVIRTVMNRSYLGALLFSETVLRGFKGKAYPRDYTYYELIENDLPEIGGEGLRQRLSSLRSYRREADYELAHDIPLRRSEHTIALAIQLVTEIKQKVR